MRAKIVFIFIGLFLCLNGAIGAPLTRESLRGANRVGLYFGTFDPLTLGHRAVIEAALKDGGIDRVVLCPSVVGGGKDPTAFGVRMRLIDLEFHENPNILYASDGDLRAIYEDAANSDWSHILRSLTSDAKIDILLGEDAAANTFNQIKLRTLYQPDRYVVFQRNEKILGGATYLPAKRVERLPTVAAGSSSQVRNWFADHPEIYFETAPEIPVELRSMISSNVFSEIVHSGIYLGYPGANHISMSERLKRFVYKKVLAPLNAKDLIQTYRRSRLAIRDLVSFEIGGESIPIQRYLGNGFNSNAYLIQWKGRPAVLKIPRDGPAFRDDILRSAVVNEWLQKHSALKTAELYAVAPDGSFMITEFKDAPTLEKVFQQNRFNENLLKNGEKTYLAVRNLYAQSGMLIDVNSGNFVVEGDELILVDTGLQRRGFGLPPSFLELLKEWSPISFKTRCQRLLGFERNAN